jgi:hypothetical protein
MADVRALVNDLPHAIAGLETPDEEDPFREACAVLEGAQRDVDDHCAPPYTRSALVLGLSAALPIHGRQIGRNDLGLSRRVGVEQSSGVSANASSRSSRPSSAAVASIRARSRM